MNLLSELMVDNFDVEIISAEEYEQLDEGAQRAYRRVGNNITQYYRCTSGPKKGKLASDPSKCGQRKDPKRVRHGRQVAQRKGSIRVRKTQARKRTQLSKRVTQLNTTLRKRNEGPKKTTRESFAGFLDHSMIVEGMMKFSETEVQQLCKAIELSTQFVSELDTQQLQQLLMQSSYDIADIDMILDVEYMVDDKDATFVLKIRFQYGNNKTGDAKIAFNGMDARVINLNVV